MSERTPPPPPETLRVDRLVELLPGVAELHPLLELLVASSRPDPERRWSTSGELGSAGDRLVDSGRVAAGIDAIAQEEAERLRELLGRTARFVEHLTRGATEPALALLLEQGEEEEIRSRLPEAAAWYRAAHRLARVSSSPLAPRALRRAARVDRARGRLESAARGYEDAFREAEGRAASEEQVTAAIGRGNVAVDRGRWVEAERWYRNALALLGDEGPPSRAHWQIAQNLGIVHRRKGEMDSARAWLTRAASHAAEVGDPEAGVEVSNGWGQLLLEEGDPRGAELHFRRALEAAERPRARVTVRVNLGEALLAQGRDLEAGQEARTAEAAALAHGVTGKLPEVYRLLAAVAHARGEADGFVLLERALALIAEWELPAFEEALTRQAYARAMREVGQVERAEELEAEAAKILAALKGEET